MSNPFPPCDLIETRDVADDIIHNFEHVLQKNQRYFVEVLGHGVVVCIGNRKVGPDDVFVTPGTYEVTVDRPMVLSVMKCVPGTSDALVRLKQAWD